MKLKKIISCTLIALSIATISLPSAYASYDYTYERTYNENSYSKRRSGSRTYYTRDYTYYDGRDRKHYVYDEYYYNSDGDRVYSIEDYYYDTDDTKVYEIQEKNKIEYINSKDYYYDTDGRKIYYSRRNNRDYYYDKYGNKVYYYDYYYDKHGNRVYYDDHYYDKYGNKIYYSDDYYYDRYGNKIYNTDKYRKYYDANGNKTTGNLSINNYRDSYQRDFINRMSTVYNLKDYKYTSKYNTTRLSTGIKLNSELFKKATKLFYYGFAPSESVWYKKDDYTSSKQKMAGILRREIEQTRNALGSGYFSQSTVNKLLETYFPNRYKELSSDTSRLEAFLYYFGFVDTYSRIYQTENYHIEFFESYGDLMFDLLRLYNDGYYSTTEINNARNS